MSSPIRGSAILTSTASSVVVPWPAGTVVNDLVVIFATAAYGISLPSGWTSAFAVGGTTWNAEFCWKVMTSADITAGSVTVTWGGSFEYEVGVISFAGGTVEEMPVGNPSNTASFPISTSSAVQSTDVLVYFASQRFGLTGNSIVSSRGTLLQSGSTSVTNSVLYQETSPVSGVVTTNFTTTTTGGNDIYGATLVVRGTTGGGGITVGPNTFNLITIPSYPCFADIQMTIQDATAVVQSAYVLSQWQTQAWPGSDAWAAQCNLPPMDPETAAPWRAFLADAAGMLNVFQLGDQGALQGFARFAGGFEHQTLQYSNPVVDGTVSTNNPISGKVLATRGWRPSTFRLLMPGAYLQIGYRLHMVAGQVPVNSDSNGNARIPVWPSLRETPPDGTALILTKPVGLFRLAQNKRDWHTAVTRFTSISFKVVEVR